MTKCAARAKTAALLPASAETKESWKANVLEEDKHWEGREMSRAAVL